MFEYFSKPMKRVITQDNSTTFYNEIVGESYHSISGAIEEAKEKHVFPSQILSRIQKEELASVTILDFCFGLGYNSLVAHNSIRKQYPTLPIHIFALENDIQIMKALTECVIGEEFQHSKELFCQGIKHFELTKNPIQKIDKHTTIHFYLDNAKKSIVKIPTNSVDVVFFDPFSPKKMPELWTKEIFEEVYRSMKKSARLTTYSCARRVREAMKEAKFIVIDGPCVGRKSPGTIGIKK
jgi:tRNA U34 5-methylaminomethyl-2-thiouridine-forming methyltransferase MnmC